MGSLGTRIGGEGRRASTVKRTGTGGPTAACSGLRKEENIPPGFLVADRGSAGMNSCFLRAKASAPVGGGRGGSIGRKTNGSY